MRNYIQTININYTQQQKKALATSMSDLEKALKKNKKSGILHWFTKTRNFLNSFGKNVKQMPVRKCNSFGHTRARAHTHTQLWPSLANILEESSVFKYVCTFEQVWKKDDSECLLAWEPAVKCYRITRLKSCSKDTQCACGAGCSGMGLTQSNLIWKPVCYRVSWGINHCICGLVHNAMPKESCTWPKRYPSANKHQDAQFYSGSGGGGFTKYKPRPQY